MCFANSETYTQSKDYSILNNSKDINLNTLVSPDSSDCVIYIKSDQDLINYSFPGSGSESDPYRIENLSISSTKDYGIYLENTTKYVLIQNCYIYAHYRAIEIYNTTENTLTISNNTLSSDNYFGIFVGKSPYIKILKNVIYNCYHAIEFNDCPYTIIANNTLLDNVCCIRVEYSSPYSQIRENNITNNYEVIWLANSGGHFLIKDNLIVNNNFGILLSSGPGPYFPDFCSIIHNLIEGTGWYGLIVESNYNIIFQNSFVNNNIEGTNQAKDLGLNNIWYNSSVQKGNYWSDWWGFGSYNIDGSAKSYDPYPSELPFHATNSLIPKIFIGRVILRLTLGLSYPAFVIISFLIVKKSKKKKL
ncbi:MAG: nitrous oxide reductase family maturation protein NosD [Promethearchaeota archaeon]